MHERRGGVPAVDTPDMLYVRSPEAMKRLALSYQSLLADVYWIRAVQHYGGTRLSNDPNASYDLLYPLLDLTTSLDPRFNVAYLFGSLFLAGPPPGGPGRPDLAIALLEKGLRAQPQKWEFAQAIGFVHYWWRQDYPEAAAWFQRAAEMPGGPFWLKSMAAVTLAEGGRRDSSRQLWQELARSEFEWFRNEGQRRLQQLDAMDQIDQLQAAADALRATVWPASCGLGRPPAGRLPARLTGGSNRGALQNRVGPRHARSRVTPVSVARAAAASTMTPLVVLVFALAGLMIGSFLNVCIYRLPRRESIVWPASHCTACNRPLAWFENVPVVELAGAARPLPDVRRAHLRDLPAGRADDGRRVRRRGAASTACRRCSLCGWPSHAR